MVDTATKKESVVRNRFTLRMHPEVRKALAHASIKHNITMTKFVMRAILKELMREGYIDDVVSIDRGNVFFL